MFRELILKLEYYKDRKSININNFCCKRVTVIVGIFSQEKCRLKNFTLRDTSVRVTEISLSWRLKEKIFKELISFCLQKRKTYKWNSTEL